MPSKDPCQQRNFGKMLKDFHPKKGLLEVGSQGNGTVVGQEDRIMLRHQISEAVCQFICGRSPVRSNRNTTQGQDDLRHQSFTQGNAGHCVCRAVDGVSVANSAHVRPSSVDNDMHLDLTRDLPHAFKLISLQVGHDQVVGL